MSRFFFNHAAHGNAKRKAKAKAKPKWDEGWTVAELRDKAAELDIAGRSAMKRAELVAAISRAEA